MMAKYTVRPMVFQYPSNKIKQNRQKPVFFLLVSIFKWLEVGGKSGNRVVVPELIPCRRQSVTFPTIMRQSLPPSSKLSVAAKSLAALITSLTNSKVLLKSAMSAGCRTE